MEKVQRQCLSKDFVKSAKILLNFYYKQRGVGYEYSHFVNANLNIRLPLLSQRYVDFRMDREYYRICAECFARESELEHKVSRYMQIKYVEYNDGLFEKNHYQCYLCKTPLYSCAIKLKCNMCKKITYKIKRNV
ncbi:hypothetical protein ManeNPV_00031 [Malacosoma neustria nucleopolyhedrovirus]|uniref:hypothetical protein n=1 Tax=Malacosoma neustria nuclear polyhedrosis virus TaxID=38012 RepID=UPI000E359345|nr:hypothetical protein ManeNPV_00031 [Malacosoma neustria nucleopolyhedrovirus]AUF81559.1 hypothetical protein ManeNPV_00031 [Malacosoma neustria nucleopolyhedrovirus]